MKAHTELVLCVRCRLYKKASEFSHFYSARKVHVRECDYCHDHPFDIAAKNLETKAKRELQHAKLTPMQKALSNTEYAKSVQARKSKIEAIKAKLELKRIKEETL